MRIGIDVDDTITNTWEDIMPGFSKVFNIPIEELKNSTPYYRALKEDISLDEYFDKILPLLDEMIPKVSLKDNVKEVIDKLYELGHHVIFITARGRGHTNPYEDTKNYLDRHHIKYDKIVVNAEGKDVPCKEEKIDVFIDDSIKHCTLVKKLGIEVIMLDTYYNHDAKEFKHCKNWNEIYDYLKDKW